MAAESSALACAYRQTHYQIASDPAVTLRVGASHPALARHATGYTPGGVFLTACNPRSRRLRPKANARRHRALQRALAQRGWQTVDGVARDPAGIWPDERSLWVPGLPLAEGRRLARRFGQNALIWCDAQTVAHLVWLARSRPAASDKVKPSRDGNRDFP